MDLIWVASYPRSGNTWVRFLLASLIDGPPEHTAAVEERIPDVHARPLRQPKPFNGHGLAKTHAAFGPRLPSRDASAGFIYISRDPLDLLKSNFDFYRLNAGAEMRDWDAAKHRNFWDKYVGTFLQLGGDPRWFNIGAERWDRHVRSWLDDAAHLPHVALRYEDMIADPLPAAAQLCEFLDLDRSPAEIEAAVAGATFERMRALEEQAIEQATESLFFRKERTDGYRTGQRFINRGGSGLGRQVLDDAQRRAAYRTFGAEMRRLGYDTGQTRPTTEALESA